VGQKYNLGGWGDDQDEQRLQGCISKVSVNNENNAIYNINHGQSKLPKIGKD
jgi:hypothetical protein